tara:strand:+ start:3315 stop:3506 length:192 start_codon:yes stop_codon:yes gene_type:complete
MGIFEEEQRFTHKQLIFILLETGLPTFFRITKLFLLDKTMSLLEYSSTTVILIDALGIFLFSN